MYALEQFREGKVDFLIASDVAARGLDIVGIKTVINYQLPLSMPSYVHRVGRTARAGKAGRAVSLIGDSDRKLFKMILKSSQGKVKQRAVPPEAVAQWSEKIRSFAKKIEEIEKEEKEEQELQMAEMEVRKMENMIKHYEEITTRPKRGWFISEKDKAAIRRTNVLFFGTDDLCSQYTAT